MEKPMATTVRAAPRVQPNFMMGLARKNLQTSPSPNKSSLALTAKA